MGRQNRTDEGIMFKDLKLQKQIYMKKIPQVVEAEQLCRQ